MFGDDLIGLIDQRIRVATAQTRATGTCISRETTGNSADVLFTGSTVAMPVRVLGSVFLRPGDRCVLDLYGTDWVVTGSWAALGYGEASAQALGPPGGTSSLSSGSYVDLSDIAPITFDKVADGTFIRMALSIGCYCEGSANSGVQFGFRWTPVTPSSFAATDFDMARIFFNQISVHETASNFGRWLDIPAGRWLVQLRWRRTAGSGTFKMDSSDQISIELDERIRASAPIL